MRYSRIYKHYIKSQFLWNLPTLMVLICITCSLLIGKELGRIDPDFLNMFLIFIFFIGPFISFGHMLSITSGGGRTTHEFSRKYMLSLPVPRYHLLNISILSSLYSTIPGVIIILWISFSYKVGSSWVLEDGPVLKIIANYSAPTIALYWMFFIWSSSMFLKISFDSERTQYGKFSLKAYLLGAKNMGFDVWLMILFCALAGWALIKLNFFLFPIALVSGTVVAYFRARHAAVNERSTYFKKSRDIPILSIMVGSFAYLAYIGFFQFDEYDWKNYYKGDSRAFLLVKEGDWKGLEDLIQKDKDQLIITNDFGVALSHAISINIDAPKKLKELIYNDGDLRKLPIGLMDGCVDTYYCSGLTNMHLLAASGFEFGPKEDSSKTDFELKTKEGKTPLHYSSMSCPAYRSTVSMLRLGAYKEAQDIKGQTPLFETINHTCWLNLAFLIQAGADPHHKDKEDISPLQLAKNLGYHAYEFYIENRVGD